MSFRHSDSVDILGTEYKIKSVYSKDFPKLKTAVGVCENCAEELFISKDGEDRDDYYLKYDKFQRKVLRHEIIHAFMWQSGFTDISTDEEERITEWISIMAPKMLISFAKSGALENETLKELAEVMVNDYDDKYRFNQTENNRKDLIRKM